MVDKLYKKCGQLVGITCALWIQQKALWVAEMGEEPLKLVLIS